MYLRSRQHKWTSCREFSRVRRLDANALKLVNGGGFLNRLRLKRLRSSPKCPRKRNSEEGYCADAVHCHGQHIHRTLFVQGRVCAATLGPQGVGCWISLGGVC